MMLDIKYCLSLTLVSLFLLGCSSQDWQVRAVPNQAVIAAALDDTPDPIVLGAFDVTGYPAVTMPQSVRPCCAFGNDQIVKLGPATIPFYRYANTVDLADIGPHAFDAGTFSYQKAAPDGKRGTENNGLIYTRLGGFIDLAHVRDTADNAVALFFQIYPYLGQERIIDLPPELGVRQIRLSAFDVSHLSAKQRWELAAAMAVRQAYFMAEAHEIAQWHGYRSWAPWSEEISAYSPEDLYSNMLGAKIAHALISNNLVMNKKLFNQHMSRWLHETLVWLEPVTKQQTNALFDVIDGEWWASTQPLPSKFLLLLRHYQLGDTQSPYLVPQVMVENNRHHQLLAPLYERSTEGKTLTLPQSLYGVDIDQVLVQHLQVKASFKASFSHIPTYIWQRGFTHLDFAQIAEFDRQADAEQLFRHKGK